MRAMVANTINDAPSGMLLPNTRPAGEMLNGYPTSNAGYAYELNTDWTIYDIENWISNESNSLALLGIQQVLTSGLDGIEWEKVAEVTASPASGSVKSGTQITLHTATPGAAIYYTLDGSTPTLASKVYSDNEKITITENITLIKAYAIKGGMIDSPVTEFRYTALPAADIEAPYWSSSSSLTASKIGKKELTLTWSAASDNIGVTGYKVYVLNGNHFAEIANAGEALTVDLTNLAPGRPYTFTIKATDAAGNWSDYGPQLSIRLKEQ